MAQLTIASIALAVALGTTTFVPYLMDMSPLAFRYLRKGSIRRAVSAVMTVIFLVPAISSSAFAVPTEGPRHAATARIVPMQEHISLTASHSNRHVERFIPVHDIVFLLPAGEVNRLVPTELVTLRASLSVPPLILTLLYTVTVTSFL